MAASDAVFVDKCWKSLTSNQREAVVVYVSANSSVIVTPLGSECLGVIFARDEWELIRAMVDRQLAPATTGGLSGTVNDVSAIGAEQELLDLPSMEIAQQVNPSEHELNFATNGNMAGVLAAVAPAPVKPRTLAEVDADPDADELAHLRLDKDQKATLLREIIGEIQMLSDGVKMPAQAVWDERKPSSLPTAGAIYHRFNLNWSQLADYAKLEYKARGPKSSGKDK